MAKIIYMHTTINYLANKGISVMPDHDDEVIQNETYVTLKKRTNER